MRGISWLAERTLSFLSRTLLHGVRLSNADCIWSATVRRFPSREMVPPPFQHPPKMTTTAEILKPTMVFCNIYETILGVFHCVMFTMNGFGVGVFLVGFSLETRHRGCLCYLRVTWVWKGDIVSRMYILGAKYRLQCHSNLAEDAIEFVVKIILLIITNFRSRGMKGDKI
jgi:hypothetical protein